MLLSESLSGAVCHFTSFLCFCNFIFLPLLISLRLMCKADTSGPRKETTASDIKRALMNGSRLFVLLPPSAAAVRGRKDGLHKQTPSPYPLLHIGSSVLRMRQMCQTRRLLFVTRGPPGYLFVHLTIDSSYVSCAGLFLPFPACVQQRFCLNYS